jgi:hypothetical protein
MDGLAVVIAVGLVVIEVEFVGGGVGVGVSGGGGQDEEGEEEEWRDTAAGGVLIHIVGLSRIVITPTSNPNLRPFLSDFS